MEPATDPDRAYHERNQRTFARLAPVYDLVTAPLRGLRRQVTRLAEILPGMRVLDVATGTGAQAFAFARAGADVVGVDVSTAMLAVARRHNHSPRVRFVAADAARLPFEDASFDAACISFGLHEMPGHVRTQVVGEMARVTRPGGLVIVVDYVLPPNALAAALVDRAIRLYEPEHHVGFLRADVRALLEAAEVSVLEDHRVALGAVRVMIGSRR